MWSELCRLQKMTGRRHSEELVVIPNFRPVLIPLRLVQIPEQLNEEVAVEWAAGWVCLMLVREYARVVWCVEI